MDLTEYFKNLKEKQTKRQCSSLNAPEGKASLTEDSPALTTDTVNPIVQTQGKIFTAINQSSQMLSFCNKASLYNHKQEAATKNLEKIKTETNKPKEKEPDARFEKIKEHLGENECYQTIREERWEAKVYCPYCSSIDVERISTTSHFSPFNFRYLCNTCHSRFNDDSKTPFETKIPSLETWIQCWYLLGCTNSLEYIAARLHLELNTIKDMVGKLQKIFDAKQPFSKPMQYEQWHKGQAKKVAVRIEEEINLLQQQELIQGETTLQPKDTAEIRRQKERHKHLPGSTKPTNKKI